MVGITNGLFAAKGATAGAAAWFIHSHSSPPIVHWGLAFENSQEFHHIDLTWLLPLMCAVVEDDVVTV